MRNGGGDHTVHELRSRYLARVPRDRNEAPVTADASGFVSKAV